MNFLTPHRRWNPLKEEWILVSPQRGMRPWRGAVEKPEVQDLPDYDPKCNLCPGNDRSNGVKNPRYNDVFVFENDFPAVMPGEPSGDAFSALGNVIKAAPEQGLARVLCFSPQHNLTIPEMNLPAIEAVIECWHDQYQELAQKNFISHVMIFENKGSAMGCSNPHPHGQIWATSSIPNLPLRSASAQRNYFAEHKKSLLSNYLDWELAENKRVVCQNEHWVALVPFWAAWPYEIMIMPRRTIATIAEMSLAEKAAWAAIFSAVTIRYDNLFETSFPYSMGVYQKPTDGQAWDGFHLHQIFLPPLLRSATVKKFMVGYELCAETQRDITPEQAAEKLAGLPEVRFA